MSSESVIYSMNIVRGIVLIPLEIDSPASCDPGRCTWIARPSGWGCAASRYTTRVRVRVRVRVAVSRYATLLLLFGANY